MGKEWDIMPFYVELAADNIDFDGLRKHAEEDSIIVLPGMVIHPRGVIKYSKGNERWFLELHGDVYELARFIIPHLTGVYSIRIVYPIERLDYLDVSCGCEKIES